MPNTVKRHFLKEKETEKILRELSLKLNIDTEQLLGPKPHIELAETRSIQIFLVNGKPTLTRLNGTLAPTLTFQGVFPRLPKITVDMGAVPHICNGADLMAPGIVRINGDFNRNDILLMVDERHEKPLAIGVALYDSQHTRRLTQGKVAKNIHHVGDKLWNLLKRM